MTSRKAASDANPPTPIAGDPAVDTVNKEPKPEANVPDAEVTPPAEEPSIEELNAELKAEVSSLIDRMQAADPSYAPPPFSVQGLTNLLTEGAARYVPSPVTGLFGKGTIDWSWG